MAGQGEQQTAGEHEVSRQVRAGQERCPRCHGYFTLSYWVDGAMVQARCLNCDLKWPLPDVV